MMLDAWTIDRIRREKAEREREAERLPLHQEPPPPPEKPPKAERKPERKPERGIVDIDFDIYED